MYIYIYIFFFIYVTCNCLNSSKQEVKHVYYNLSIFGEKYQLDWSKIANVVKWLFFNQIKVFWSIPAQKNKTKTKVRKGLSE